MRLPAALATGLRGLALVVVALAMVYARVLVSSRGEWRQSEARLAAGDAMGAIDHAGRAARLYAPVDPWSRRAFERLAELARRAEEHGDGATALAAWREVRASSRATRSLYTPHRDLAVEADARIALLMARSEPPEAQPGASEEQRRQWHAERLARDDSPSVAWSLLALLGFLGWVGAALGLLLTAIDDDDRLRPRPAAAWGLAIASGVALFLVGLGRA